MKTIQISNLKANMSKILEKIEQNNEELIIEYGQKHKKIAVIIPYSKYIKERIDIKFGYLKGKASMKINENFVINDEEFINS